MRDILVFVFSPTRFIIEFLKPKVRDYRKCIHRWNLVFRSIMLVMVVGLWFVRTGVAIRHLPMWLVYVALWALPFSRINELVFAFYRDAVEQLTGSRNGVFSRVERLQLLVLSYFEVAIQFGILYFCLPRLSFSKEFSSIIEAIYFSVVTITTAGYGDITPKGQLSQFACMYELGAGFLLIIFALGAYFASSSTSSGENSP